MSFTDAAIESAQLYYDYLEKKDKGIVPYTVKSITPDQNSFRHNEYWLELSKPPKNIEGLKIRIDGTEFSNEEINPVIYDSHENKLKVRLSNNMEGVFERHRPRDVKVVSDLKFLVQRVKTWYQRSGRCIALPIGKQTVQLADCYALSKEPSEEQTNAVLGSLAEPFTYVWGAPGTGKTQVVLARSVLAYIHAGKKILVAAPTNNAVEQTLYGILPVLKEAGLDYNNLVIRLGTASVDFHSKYPGVCEDSGYSKAISEVLDSITKLLLAKEEISKQEQLYFECQAFQQRLSTFTDAVGFLKKQISRIFDADRRVTNAQTSVDEIFPNITQKKVEQEENNNSMAFYKWQAQDLLQKFHNPVHTVFSWLNGKNEKDKIDAALKSARYYEEKLDRINSELDVLNAEERLRQDILSKEQAALEKLILDAVQQARPYAEIYAAAKRIRTDNIAVSLHELNDACDRTKKYFESERMKYENVSNRERSFFEKEKQKIDNKIQLCEQHRTELEHADPNKRIEKCQIIACTIDLCLSRFPVSKENYFDHVFLDEASYSSLIKAVTLTAYSDKITFLGDHMQLPPVCEADDDIIRRDNCDLIALWAQSALFTETVFYEQPGKVCSDYLDRTPIPLNVMRKYSLVNSYRFGVALARVLADDVYDSTIRGHDGQDTRIYYIDAPKVPEQKKRISTAECEAIKELLKKDKNLQNTSGIIAPYRNQVDILKQMAKENKLSEDNIFTVHQSQGREWDNVILSVTDTTKKYFMDSLNPESNGKKVINTAVSRARKNLFIVCDYNYWIRQESQLIGKLLKVAERYSLDAYIRY